MIQDTIYFFVMLFVIGVFIVALNIAWNGINDGFQSSDAISGEAKAMFGEQTSRFPTTMDYSFVFILVAVFIAILLVSYYVSTNPILFWVFWIIIMVLSAVGGYLANAWEASTEEGVLASSVLQFPMIDYTLSHYMHVTIILGMLMLLVFFAKPSGGEPV